MPVRPLTICLAMTLVVSMATSALASCLADVSMNAAAQMACCKQGHDKCPMVGTPDDCCKTDAQTQQPLSAATHELVRATLSSPPLAVTISYVPFIPVGLLRASALDRHRLVLKGPSPPAFFLTSALLI
jgi:hypothetical protein